MRKAFLVATLLTVLEVPAPAGKIITLRGYLVDQMCSEGIASQGLKAAAEHDRTCALMELCVESRFGVLTENGAFVAFDEAGSERALAAIESSSKDGDYKVTVTGEWQREQKFKVHSLKLE